MSDYIATDFSQVVKLGEEDREERFDFTGSDTQGQGDSMLSVAGSPRRNMNPWSFMDTFNPKKQALAIAREIDVKRGIRLELPLKQEIPASDAGVDEGSSQSTIRRVPSGAKPQPNGPNLRVSTPMETEAASSNNANEQSIDDVAGQSTPLTLARISDQGKTQADRGNHNERDNELRAMSKILEDRNKQVESLHQEILARENRADMIAGQLNELKSLLDVSEKNRLMDNETTAGIIKDLREEIGRKNHSIDDLSRRSDEMREKFEIRREKLDETIEGLKEQLSHERDSAFSQIRAADRSWQDRLEEREATLLASKESEKTQYEREISNLREELNNKLRENDSLQTKMDAQSKELGKAVQALEQARSTSSELKNRNSLDEEKLKDVEKQNQQLKRDLQASKASCHELQTEGTVIRKKLQMNEGRIKELEESLETATSAQSALRNEYAQAMKQVEDAEKLQEQLKSELRVNTESLDKSQAQCNELEEKLKDVSKINEDLKGRVLEIEKKSENESNKYDELQTAVRLERLDHEKAAKALVKCEERSEKITKFMDNLTLFDVHIGTVMLHAFEKNHQVTCLDPFLNMQNKEIVGFHTRSHDQKHQELERKVESTALKNQKLSSQIDNEWKAKVSSLTREMSNREKLLIEVQSKLEETQKKCQGFEARQAQSQDEKADMLKEKEKMIQAQAELNDTINVLKGGNFDKEQDKIVKLVEKMEKVTSTINQIREQIKLETEENGKLKTLIEIKDKDCCELRKINDEQKAQLEGTQNFKPLLESRESEITELRAIQEQQRSELERLTNDLKRLEGDDSRRITFEIARQSRPDIDRELYDKLMINKVDFIDRVELQNIVKNLILLLEIPFNKLTKKGPLVAIYLKYERPIFSYFANRLHFELFNEAIDMRRFTNEAFDQYTENHNMDTIKHPLEACLENLHQKLISRI